MSSTSIRSGSLFSTTLLMVIAFSASTAIGQVDQIDQVDQVDSIDSDRQQDTQSGEAARQRPIEEITVNADTNILALRYRLHDAEDAMYAQFNELNSRDEFDVECKVIRHTRSYIAQRSCEPKFLTRERQSNVMQVVSQLRDGGVPSGGGLGGAAVNGGSDVATSLNLNAIDDYQRDDSELKELLSKKYEEMGQDMFRIASENPEFLQALTRVENFRKALSEARAERFEK